MKTINANTIKGQNFINAYNKSTDTELCHVYGRCSDEKIKADYFCRKAMSEEGGNGYKIIGHNCNYFTVAWRTKEGDLRVRTAYNNYIVK